MSTPRRTRATGRVTLDDVAAVAHVSPITASRALRGQANVSPELAARVQEAARKLGYVPDPAARALASARSTLVPVLVPARRARARRAGRSPRAARARRRCARAR